MKLEKAHKLARNYYRRITALFPKDFLNYAKKHKILKYLYPDKAILGQKMAQLVFTFLLILMPLLAYLLFQLSGNYVAVVKEKAGKEQALSYWENVLSKSPNLPDAYYKAAVYALSLNQKEKARGYIEKALFLDPEFEEAKALLKAIR